MRFLFCFFLFCFSSKVNSQLTTATNPYFFQGQNIENTLFPKYFIEPNEIASQKIHSITEENRFGKTVYHFNKSGQHYLIEVFDHKNRLCRKTILKYDSNHFLQEIIDKDSHFKSKDQAFYSFNKKGTLLDYKEYRYNKNKIIDSLVIVYDSTLTDGYYISSTDSSFTCKINSNNEIITYSSNAPYMRDSISTLETNDTLYKTYWHHSFMYKQPVIGKKEVYFNNKIIDKKVYNRNNSEILEIHETYQYDNLNRLTSITWDDFYKDKTLFIYYHHGHLYQKIERISEMEFLVTKYSYNYYTN